MTLVVEFSLVELEMADNSPNSINKKGAWFAMLLFYALKSSSLNLKRFQFLQFEKVLIDKYYTCDS